MISIIVAISEENAIGKNGDLLCHLPADLKHFKEVTSGHTVIMGKRTWFSLPISKKTGTHALPNRKNIVITDIPEETFEGAVSAYSIDDAISKIDKDEEAFIIGGGMIYKQFMPLADSLYITRMHHSWPDADTFFPEIDEAIWESETVEHHSADDENPTDYSFIKYTKRGNH